MATHLNGKNLQGLVGGTITFTQPVTGTEGTAMAGGYVSPNLQGFDLSHKGNIDRVPNQGGNTATLIANDEYIEITFDYFPQGSSEANALKSAIMPKLLSKAFITGLPIVQIGAFTDALNTNGVNTQPWIYEGDGGVAGKAKEKWDGKITLRRYVEIEDDAVYTVV